VIEAVRRVILENLPAGYQETMQYGMIGYSVPHSIYPAGYHCDPSQPLPYAALASQKNHMAIYLSAIYQDEAQRAAFERQWAASGAPKLDAGKSCVRFKKLEHLSLETIATAIRSVSVDQFIANYERARDGSSNAGARRSAAKSNPSKGNVKPAAVKGKASSSKRTKASAKPAAKKTSKKIAGTTAKSPAGRAAPASTSTTSRKVAGKSARPAARRSNAR
jgi:hypothetical protein